MNTLHIDTSDRTRARVVLKTAQEEFEEASDPGSHKVQVLIPLIEKVLVKAQISADMLDTITVMQGPGSFTGLRVGVAVANTLSFALQKPFPNQKLGYTIDAIY